nr:hypothetical protein [Gordonia sp. LAM0048]
MDTVLGYVPNEFDRAFLTRVCNAAQRGDNQSVVAALDEIDERADSDAFYVAIGGMGGTVLVLACNKQPTAVSISAVSSACYPRVRRLLGCSHSYFYDRLAQLAKIPDAQPPVDPKTDQPDPELDFLIPVMMFFLLGDPTNPDEWSIHTEILRKVAESSQGGRR